MVMVRSAVKNNRRKSQREAARLQKQADAMLAMEEDEEVHFNRPDTVPDTPRVSRTNSPDREEGDDREVKDYTAVLEMVKTVRDRLTALVLDNTNIRAACDDLRRQCHSQGVAFGDLSRLVKQSREDQEESRADTWEETRPHPRIRPELLDGGGNLRARYRDHVAGRRYLSSWCPDNGTEGRHGGQPSTTGDSGTIPAVSRGTGGRPSPTGDVDTLPTESRTPVRRHVDAGISTSGVHRDV